MKKYIKNFIESCVNFYNVKSLIVVMLIALLLTDKWSLAFLSGGVYIVTLIMCWETLKYIKDEKK